MKIRFRIGSVPAARHRCLTFGRRDRTADRLGRSFTTKKTAANRSSCHSPSQRVLFHLVKVLSSATTLKNDPAAPSTETRPSGHSDARIDGQPRVLVGICTFNEAANIGGMLSAVRKALPAADILVVDDDSPDGTAELAQTIADADGRMQVIVRKDERGLGGAIRRAIEVAIEGDYAYFLNLDGDLSHSPSQLPELLCKAQSEGRYDVVIGSRYVPGGAIEGWPMRRRVMSRMLNGFATLCLGLPVHDCSGSMRCYRVQTLKQIDRDSLRSNGYALLEEILVRLHRHRASMAEVPIIFTDRTRGDSKLTASEAMRSLAQIVRLSWS